MNLARVGERPWRVGERPWSEWALRPCAGRTAARPRGSADPGPGRASVGGMVVVGVWR